MRRSGRRETGIGIDTSIYRELSCTRRDNTTEVGSQVDDTSMIEHIHSLQQELIAAHNRLADHDNLMKDAKQRISVSGQGRIRVMTSMHI